MKVVKAAVDLATWSLPATCPNCLSELEVEVKDIYYDYDRNGNHWRVQCCLCEKYFRVDVDDLPALVQADIIKHRYVSHYCDD